MSGGSLEYLGSKLECGEGFEDFQRYAGEMLAMLAAVEKKLEQEPGGAMTVRRMALECARQRIARLTRDMATIATDMRSFAMVARVLDRYGSSDDGEETVASTCLQWMRRELGLVEEKG